MTLKVSLTTRKVIGLQYLGVGGIFFFLGYLSYFLAKIQLPPNSDGYRNIAALHGTMIVFFGIVPVLFVGPGYFLLSLKDGVETWWKWPSFAGLALYYLSGILVLVDLFVPESPCLILAMLLNLAFALICSGIFVVAIIRNRLCGIGWLQMRSMVWTLLITAFVILLAFSLLEFAAVKQLQGYLVSGLSTSSPTALASDMPVLWWHIIWLLAHPEVYIILLLMLGLMLDGVRVIFRRPAP